MTVQDILEYQNKIRKALAVSNVTKALSYLRMIAYRKPEAKPFEAELRSIFETFRYMLRFFADGKQDVTRETFVAETVTRLYALTDELLVAVMTPHSTDLFYTRRKQPATLSLSDLFADYRQSINKIQMLERADAEANRTVIDNLRQHLEAVEVTAFNSVWTAFPLSEEQADTLRLELTSDDLPESFAAILLSALLLGMTKFYDDRKFAILCDVYERWHDDRFTLASRALVAIVITVFCYRSRLSRNSDALKRLDALATLTHWQSDVKATVIRLSRARNTENISRKVKTDLMPDINKLSPDLLRHIRDGKDPVTAIADMEENPEWGQWLKESGIEDKLRRFNDMQLEGDDVYLSTFSRLKTFPFFNTLANWFMPFHSDHSAVRGNGDAARVAMADLLATAPVVCNSDKYSIFFSITAMPASRQRMVAGQFEEHREVFREMEESEVVPDLMRRDILINVYIHDLYRFFRLFSRRREFYDVFNETFNVLDTSFATRDVIDNETVATIAEFYFKNEFYDDAVAYYDHLLADAGDPRLYQKVGYARQRQGRYFDAIDAYRKYELVRDNDLWTIRHIAACYRAAGNTESAIASYRRALDLDPNNISTIMNFAKLLLDTGNTTEALSLYFKADVLSENNWRARRAIAWCSLLLGNYEQSEKAYRRIIADGNPTYADYMNNGHLMLILGRTKDAVEQYGQCILQLAAAPRQPLPPPLWFANLAEEDRHILLKAGVTPLDFMLAIQAAKTFTEIDD